MRLLCGRHSAVAAVVALALVALGACPASATWLIRGTGTGRATAATVGRPAAPAVAKSGTTAVVTWTATTLSNGVAADAYSVVRHAGATTTTVCTTTAPTVTCTDSAPVTGSQTYGVVAKYRNWASQESVTTAFVFDTVAPTVTATASGTPNANGWINTASSTVTVSATDAGSGVASVAYRVNTGNWTTVTGSSTSFAVTAQGTTTITYTATDNAGNTANNGSLTIKLDNVAPTVAMTYPPTGVVTSASWNGNCRTSTGAAANGLCGTSADATSGVSTISYELRRTPTTGGTAVCWNTTTNAFASTNCGTYRAVAAGPTAVTSWYVALAANKLGTGNFELRILVTDAAGNSSTVVDPVRTFTVNV